MYALLAWLFVVTLLSGREGASPRLRNPPHRSWERLTLADVVADTVRLNGTTYGVPILLAPPECALDDGFSVQNRKQTFIHVTVLCERAAGRLRAPFDLSLVNPAANSALQLWLLGEDYEGGGCSDTSPPEWHWGDALSVSFEKTFGDVSAHFLLCLPTSANYMVKNDASCYHLFLHVIERSEPAEGLLPALDNLVFMSTTQASPIRLFPSFDPSRFIYTAQIFPESLVTVLAIAAPPMLVGASYGRAQGQLVGSTTMAYLKSPASVAETLSIAVHNSTAQNIAESRGRAANTTEVARRELVSRYNVTLVPSEDSFSTALLSSIETSGCFLRPPFRAHLYSYHAFCDQLGALITARSFSRGALIEMREIQGLNKTAAAISSGRGMVSYSPVIMPTADRSRYVEIKVVSSADVSAQRYMVTMVPYSPNRLKDIQVTDSLVPIAFDPSRRTYNTTVPMKVRGIAIRAVPENPLASVVAGDLRTAMARGSPLNSTTWMSHYFLIRKGETRRLNIYVLDPGAVIPNKYSVVVYRESPWYSSYKTIENIANAIALFSFVISTVQSGAFVTNSKLLHFVSMTNYLNGNPEAWNEFSESFNKYNMQFVSQDSDDDDADSDDLDIFEFDSASLPLLIAPPTIKSGASVLSDGTKPSGIWEGGKLNETGVNLSQPAAQRRALAMASRKLQGEQQVTEDDEISKFHQEVQARLRFEQYISSMYLAGAIVAIGSVAYGVLWAAYLRKSLSEFFTLRQDYPSVLHPGRFWILLLDYGLVSFAQASVGIVAADSAIYGDQISLSSWLSISFNLLWWIALVTLILYPIGFIAAAFFILSETQGKLIFEEDLDQWADSECWRLKTIRHFFPFIPVLKNLTAVDITDIVPVMHPRVEGATIRFEAQAEHERQRLPWTQPYDTYALIEEQNPHETELAGGPPSKDEQISSARLLEPLMHHQVDRGEASRRNDGSREGSLERQAGTDSGWRTEELLSRPPSAIERETSIPVDTSEFLPVKHRAEIRSARATVRESVKGGAEILVDFDEARFDREEYCKKNAKMFQRYKHTIIGHNTHSMTNPYNNEIKFCANVEVRHTLPLMQLVDFFTFWAPVANLDLPYFTRYQLLLQDVPEGRFYAFGIDRLCTLLVIVAIGGITTNGLTQTVIFSLACLLIGCSHLQPAILKARKDWYAAVAEKEEEIEEKEEEEADLERRREESAAFGDEDGAVARESSKELEIVRQSIVSERYFLSLGKRLSECWGSLSDWFRNHSIWKTRLAMTIKEAIMNPCLTELLKCGVLIGLVLTHAELMMLAPDQGSTASIVLVLTAVIVANFRCIDAFFSQLSDSISEYMHYVMSFIRFCQDKAREVPLMILKGQFFIKSALRYAKGDKGISWEFPEPVLASRPRDIRVSNLTLVTPDLGLAFEGEIVPPSEAADADSGGRYHLVKTLQAYGKVDVMMQRLFRSMPLRLNFAQFSKAWENRISRLVCTIQIVNHRRHRYRRTVPHRVEDDSFLSLFTDPRFFPDVGETIRPRDLGYSITYRREEHDIRVVGRAIRANNGYTLAPYESPLLIGDFRSYPLAESPPLPDAAPMETNTETAVCTVVGWLEVKIPEDKVPWIFEPLVVTLPDGDVVEVKPWESAVDYDPAEGTLSLSSRRFTQRGDSRPYSVTYALARNVRSIPTLSGVARTHGIIEFKVPENLRLITLGRPFLLKNLTTGDATVLDPRNTDAHQFVLPKPTVGRFARLWKDVCVALRSLVDSWGVYECPCIPYSEDWEEPVPCTVLENRGDGVLRVHPNFGKCIAQANATLERTLARQALIEGSPEELSRAVGRIMSEGEFLFFWISRGVHLLDSGRWVDPLIERDHPLVRSQMRLIERRELELRNIARLVYQKIVKSISGQIRNLKNWKMIYENDNWFQIEHELEVAIRTHQSMDTVAQLSRRLKELFQPLQKVVKPQLIYPMDVDEALLQPVPRFNAQYKRWKEEITQWLRTEVGASEQPIDIHAGTAPSTYLENAVNQILTAAKIALTRPENLAARQFKSILHFVCGSRLIAGASYHWHPDPIGAGTALVRVWQTDPMAEGDQPDISKPPVWLPCSLRLCGQSVQIIMPNRGDTEREFSSHFYFEHVTGWSIPLRAFEKVKLIDNVPVPHDFRESIFFESMTSQITFVASRRSGKRQLVRRIEDGVDDNLIVVDCTEILGRPKTGKKAPDLKASLEVDMQKTARPEGSLWEKGSPQVLYAEREPIETYRLHDIFLSPRSVISNVEYSARQNLSITRQDSSRIPSTPSIRTVKFRLLTHQKVDLRSAKTNFAAEVEYEPVSDTEPAKCTVAHLQVKCTPELLERWRLVIEAAHMDKEPPWAHEDLSIEALSVSSEPTPEVSTPTTEEIGSVSDEDELLLQTPTTEESTTREHFETKNLKRPLVDGSHAVSSPDKEGVDYHGNWINSLRWGKGVAYYKARNGLNYVVSGDFEYNCLREKNVQIRSVDDAESLKLRAEREPALLWAILSYEGALKADNLERLRRRGTHPLQFEVPSANIQQQLNDSAGIEGIHDMRRTLSSLAITCADEEAGRRARLVETCDVHDDYLSLLAPGGRSRYLNGATYVGSYDEEGRPHGPGSLRLLDALCEGSFLHGRLHGAGEILHGEGLMVAKGLFEDGRRHGYCQCLLSTGATLDGMFVHDLFQDGSLTVPEGESHQITFFKGALSPDGKPSGVCAVRFRDGTLFEGLFEGGVRNGRGIIKDKDERILYDGEWRDNVPHGRVNHLRCRDGSVFSGQMQYGRRSGYGLLKLEGEDAFTVSGFWEDDRLEGRGIAETNEGTYEGMFRRNKRHGKGMFIFNDSGPTKRRYAGDWRDDRPDGRGSYMNEKGEERAYEFVKGRVTRTSLQRYRRNCRNPEGPSDDVLDIGPLKLNRFVLESDLGDAGGYKSAQCEELSVSLETLWREEHAIRLLQPVLSHV